MRGGFSGCSGMIIYDTDKKKNKDKAVYGYYENDKIVLKEGTLSEMQALKKAAEADYKGNPHETKIFVGAILLVLAFLIFIFVKCTFLGFLGWLFVCAVSFFPMLIILFALSPRYKDERMELLSNRYHGCEHAVISLIASKHEYTLENLKKSPIYDSECRTAYSGYVIFLMAALVIMVYSGLGILKIAGIMLGLTVLLFINIFNPYNPFKLIQFKVVSKPTDKEYMLGMEIINKLYIKESSVDFGK